jgi:hypothetical protein
MAFRLVAPYPSPQTATYLPNPAFSDVRRRKARVETRRSINNTLRTYVQTSPQYQFDYQFRLSRPKALELRAFIQAYYRAVWRITDHDGRLWEVRLTESPWQFSADGRAAPVREFNNIALSFEGTEVT